MSTAPTHGAARNAVIDLKVITGFMAQLASAPRTAQGVVSDHKAVKELLVKINDWSGRAVAELNGVDDD